MKLKLIDYFYILLGTAAPLALYIVLLWLASLRRKLFKKPRITNPVP